MGLGLPLAKRVLQWHGGDLTLDADSAETRFVLRWTAKRAGHESGAARTVEANIPVKA